MRLLRILVSVAAAVVGVFVGAVVGGALFVPKGSGLAGPAIALGYGLVGAVVLSMVAGLGSGRLSPRSLRIVTAVVVGAAVLVLGIVANSYRRAVGELYDPAAAYVGLGDFHVVIEQVLRRDPVLARRVEIDTERRIWAVTLPDRRVCRGNLRAAAQARVGRALATAVEAVARAAGACDDRDRGVEEILTLTMVGAPSVDLRLGLSAECLRAVPALAQAVSEVRKVNLRADSDVECR